MKTLFGKVFWNFIHDDWLIKAWVLNDNLKVFWSNFNVCKLYEKNHILKVLKLKINEILNYEELLSFIYNELTIVTQFKWNCTICDRIHRLLIKKSKKFNLFLKAIWKVWKWVINEQSAIILSLQLFENHIL